MPVHVTLRMADHVWNLRSRRSLRVFERALSSGADRLGVRVVQFSIQGNHAHLLVEADNTAALARGIQGLSIRIAKGLNRMMDRKGRVLADRYHAHVLRTPTEIRHATHYIRHNYKHHHGEAIKQDPFSSESSALAVTLPTPRTWLVTTGALLSPRQFRKQCAPYSDTSSGFHRPRDPATAHANLADQRCAQHVPRSPRVPPRTPEAAHANRATPVSRRPRPAPSKASENRVLPERHCRQRHCG